MTKINHVYTHPSFENGDRDLPYHTDKTKMSPSEGARLARWVFAILAGREHEGLNKPSWLNDGREIPSAAYYKKYNVWHYHCGPGYDKDLPFGFQHTDSILSENNFGRTGAEVYHYAKHGDMVILLGYSRLHKPYPEADSKDNPLRYRASTWKNAVPK